MRRRDIITLCAAGAALPFAAHAQQPVPVIGFLSTVTPGPLAAELAALKKGLADSGIVEGRNLTIAYRWAENQVERLPALAAELVARKVSVLVATGGLLSARAAKAATSTIPILFTGAGDPVKLGLVESLSRPGGNMTGVSFIAVELAAKRLEILRRIVPNATVVAVLSEGRDPEEDWLLEDAARALGLRLQTLAAASDRDLEAAFAAMSEKRADAALVGTGATFLNRRTQIVALATRHAIPTIYPRREYITDGGLISYSPPVTESYRQIGNYAARILQGAKPADLPVVLPTRVELAVSLKVAKTLGLTIPRNLLVLADEVIE